MESRLRSVIVSLMGRQHKVLAAVSSCPTVSRCISILIICEEAPAFLRSKFSLKIICGLPMMAIYSNMFEVFISQMALLCRSSVACLFCLRKLISMWLSRLQEQGESSILSCFHSKYIKFLFIPVFISICFSLYLTFIQGKHGYISKCWNCLSTLSWKELAVWGNPTPFEEQCKGMLHLAEIPELALLCLTSNNEM